MNSRREQPLMEQHQGGVGPYRFGRRLRVGEGLGRVYEARNEETGNPAYVVTPTGARVDLAPDVALQYLVTTSAQPAFIACELVSVPPGADASAVEAELLDVSEDVMDTLREAKRSKRGLVHLLMGRVPVDPRKLPAPPPPAPVPLPSRSGRGLRVLTALSVAAAGVLVALHASTPPPPPAPIPAADPVVEYVPATLADGVMANTLAGGSSSQPLRVERRIVVPNRPLDGQKVPPCSKPEREVNGGCWLELSDTAPCPPKTAEHKGRCYVAVPAPPGQSLWELPSRGMAPAGPAHQQP
ncbi:MULTISPECIES: hypothetical protein [unclassified Corallococcus]|uniref:hypothetical protein n=1 Tax=unclassified Corallococcus TaxID=2685029 RepID=UPI001A8CF81F|nr:MULTISPECIES: hypothetical protein [unclassified Corallococcus]MBN9687114.1 hypothetical protein [Corallococcus sp. NCSPR001]WAS89058.1 hypothetical protein O0N60_19250 [Corallococcus sp. NCRR]